VDGKSPPLEKWAPSRRSRPAHIGGQSISQKQAAGLSIAVRIDGEIVWTEGFGFADIENGSPVTPSHRFRTGNRFHRTHTRLQICLLLDEGRLKLDAEVQKYVPDFPDKNGL